MNPIRIFQRPFALFLAFLMAMTSLSCYSRRQVQSTRLPKIQNLKGLQFVLIDVSAPISNVWKLSNPKFEQDVFSARLDRASEAYGTKIASIKKNNDRAAYKDVVLLYLNANKAKDLPDTLSTRISYTDLTKIEVFEADAGKTVGGILLGIGCLAGLGLIVLAIACNCPHVYAEGPSGTRDLEGSLYGGAIFPSLERSDYLPLQNLQPVDNQYKIWLVNEEAQRQHTNQTSLEIIDHAPGLKPVFDKYGKLHTLSAPQPPIEATDISGNTVLHQVIGSDELSFLGDLDHPVQDGVEKLTLSFRKPNDAKQAKLLIRAKTDPWVDYIYFEFQNALGVYADHISRKYSRKSAAENEAWMERQKLPISVWIETTPGQWQKTEQFALAGASAFREDVLSLDLSALKGDIARIRLEFGFHFWEIDQVALDFSADQPVQQTTLRPISAQDHQGKDITSSLLDDDRQYYDQPNLGDEGQVRFEAPPLAPGMERSFVLQAKGHYEVLHTNAPGRPSLAKLNAWKKENALPRLSVERWRAAKGIALHQ